MLKPVKPGQRNKEPRHFDMVSPDGILCTGDRVLQIRSRSTFLSEALMDLRQRRRRSNYIQYEFGWRSKGFLTNIERLNQQ